MSEQSGHPREETNGKKKQRENNSGSSPSPKLHQTWLAARLLPPFDSFQMQEDAAAVAVAAAAPPPPLLSVQFDLGATETENSKAPAARTSWLKRT